MTTDPQAGLPRLESGDTLTPLVLDFLEWLAIRPRPYAEVMDVWRTSCPRLTVWEDAVDRGLVARRHDPSARCAVVDVTSLGRGLLRDAQGGTRPEGLRRAITPVAGAEPF
jgi:hypothetical protein